MKNLPAIISLFATVSLALLAAAAALGVSCPYWTLALQVAGFAWAAGVLPGAAESIIDEWLV